MECSKCGCTEYITKETGPHLTAYCSDCGNYIKNVQRNLKNWTNEQKQTVWDKTKGRCYYCGKDLGPFTVDFAIDHFKPQKYGGTEEMSNLVPSCKECNSRKKDRELEIFRSLQKKEYKFYFEIMKL